MESIDINEWLILGNIMIGDINNFGLSIMMGITNNEPDEGLKFLLTVYDRMERKKTECIFPSLEETMFFINSYVAFCHTIADISASYMNYCISECMKKSKGYSS